MFLQFSSSQSGQASSLFFADRSEFWCDFLLMELIYLKAFCDVLSEIFCSH